MELVWRGTSRGVQLGLLFTKPPKQAYCCPPENRSGGERTAAQYQCDNEENPWRRPAAIERPSRWLLVNAFMMLMREPRSRKFTRRYEMAFLVLYNMWDVQRSSRPQITSSPGTGHSATPSSIMNPSLYFDQRFVDGLELTIHDRVKIAKQLPPFDVRRRSFATIAGPLLQHLFYLNIVICEVITH